MSAGAVEAVPCELKTFWGGVTLHHIEDLHKKGMAGENFPVFKVCVSSNDSHAVCSTQQYPYPYSYPYPPYGQWSLIPNSVSHPNSGPIPTLT